MRSRPFRTLVRFIDVNYDLEEATVVLYKWTPLQAFKVSLGKISRDVLDAYESHQSDPDKSEEDYHCHVHMSTDIDEHIEFNFSEWETS